MRGALLMDDAWLGASMQEEIVIELSQSAGNDIDVCALGSKCQPMSRTEQYLRESSECRWVWPGAQSCIEAEWS